MNELRSILPPSINQICYLNYAATTFLTNPAVEAFHQCVELLKEPFPFQRNKLNSERRYSRCCERRASTSSIGLVYFKMAISIWILDCKYNFPAMLARLHESMRLGLSFTNKTSGAF